MGLGGVMAQPAITTKDDEFIAGGAVRDSAVNVDSKEQWRGYDERRFVQRMLRRLGGEGAMIARSGVATRLTCSFYTEAELRACKHVAAETRLPVGVSSILPYHFWNFGWPDKRGQFRIGERMHASELRETLRKITGDGSIKLDE
jgi:hypothetical protein